MTADGSPLQFSSTRPAGSTVTRVRDGRVDRFQLTDVPLHDGTFAAEPTHWYL
ncbi:hypothetical protein [Streptomyces sp. NPDC085937]|uniref:hypothetical protein n=1 Tax=Streptomyces sp. NPDC085937 TaxID=3365742 RepID=UPI0037CDEA08